MLVAGLGGIGTGDRETGMEVVATRQGGSGKPDFVRYVGQPDELLKLARDADVIVCALAATGTLPIRFDVLNPSAYFINIARGGSVVTADLVAALNAGTAPGRPQAPFKPEPLPADTLWKSPRVLITRTFPRVRTCGRSPGHRTVATENMRRYAAGEPMLSVVDLARGY